jgi:hypothetical protein
VQGQGQKAGSGCAGRSWDEGWKLELVVSTDASAGSSPVF